MEVNQIPEFAVQAKIMNIIDYLSSIAYTFEEKTAPLIAYYKENGTIGNIRQSTVFEYDKKTVYIGNLISRLRMEYKAGKLTDEQVATLEAMGMVWDGLAFEERIAQLVAYYKEEGSIANIKFVDKYILNGKEVQIGRLIQTLREQYKLRLNESKKVTSRRKPLTDEEVELLEKMGMIWDVTKTFEERIAVLRHYYEKEGLINKIKSHEKYDYNGKKVNIGDLIGSLREQYKARNIVETEKNKSKIRPLTDEEVETLETLGMVWNMEKTFEERIAPLVAYYKEKGTILDITQKAKYTYNGKEHSIGGLISNLRMQYKIRFLDEEERKRFKLNPLTDEEIKILESMGMVWNMEKTFEERIAPLVAYYEEKGSIAKISSKETYMYKGKEIHIGEMILNLKKQYRARSTVKEKNIKIRTRPLTDKEVEMLENLGIVWPSKSKR